MPSNLKSTTLAFISILFACDLGIPFSLFHTPVSPFWVRIAVCGILFFSLHYQFINDRRLKNQPNVTTVLVSLLLFVFVFIRMNNIGIVSESTDYFNGCLIFSALSLVIQRDVIKSIFLSLSILLFPMGITELTGTYVSFSATVSIWIFSSFLLWIVNQNTLKFIQSFTQSRLKQAISFVLICGFCFISTLFDPGIKKNNRTVLLDVTHGTSEDPRDDFTKDLKSKDYGHGRLVQFLKDTNYTPVFTDKNTNEFKSQLKKSSIFVVPMNDKPYSQEEREALFKFVNDGGGVLVIGDHTDIAGNMKAQNPLLAEFGMPLNFDTIWVKGPNREDVEYLNHPLTSGVETVSFSVGASLDPSIAAKPMYYASYNTSADYGDYKKDGYLGDEIVQVTEPVGHIVLSATNTYGNGRVVALADSAYFQNFTMYRNYAFGSRIFDWLSHKNTVKGYSYIQLIAVLCLIFLSMVLILTCDSSSRQRVLAYILLITSIVPVITSQINKQNYPDFNINDMPRKVLVDLSRHNQWMTYWQMKNNTPDNIDALFKQIIRTNYNPIVSESGKITDDMLQGMEKVFIVSPTTPYATNEIYFLHQYVRNGGNLIVVDGERSPRGSESLLAHFGVTLGDRAIMFEQPIMEDGFIDKIPTGNIPGYAHNFLSEVVPKKIEPTKEDKDGIPFKFFNPVSIEGADTVLATVRSHPVIAAVTDENRVGKGTLLVISDAPFFANRHIEGDNGPIDKVKMNVIWKLLDTSLKPQIEVATHE